MLITSARCRGSRTECSASSYTLFRPRGRRASPSSVISSRRERERERKSRKKKKIAERNGWSGTRSAARDDTPATNSGRNRFIRCSITRRSPLLPRETRSIHANDENMKIDRLRKNGIIFSLLSLLNSNLFIRVSFVPLLFLSFRFTSFLCYVFTDLCDFSGSETNPAGRIYECLKLQKNIGDRAFERTLIRDCTR